MHLCLSIGEENQLKGFTALSGKTLAVSGLIHLLILMGLTSLFCFATGVYVLHKVADACFTFGFLYGLLGLSIWGGRSFRFSTSTRGFKEPFKATPNDPINMDPIHRGWYLLVCENQSLIAWTLVGLFAMAVAGLYYSGVTGGYPPNTIVRFLVSPWLNPQYAPGGFFGP